MSFQKIILPLVLLTLSGLGFYYYNQGDKEENQEQLSIKVKKGEFIIKVTSTGELKAKHSVKIQGPQGMRSARIYQTTIGDMVTEGTVVKEGDYIATLDRTEVDQKLKEAQTEIEKIETQLAQAKIDTAIEMRGSRDELINLKFARKDKLLQVEQNKYEAESVILQAQIDLERTDRDYNQLLSKMSLTREKAEAKISEIKTSLKQQQQKMNQLMDLGSQFKITAPKSGMVIYARNWEGKVGPGSQIRAWSPVVAELPDLTNMVSKTFVNEVDISRVKKGQDVVMKVDAFPDVDYSGQVIQIANIGEELRNYDAKVFEVTIQINESDSILRPAMTTSNEIITDIIPDVFYLPLEAVHNDSLTYVFKTSQGKTVKQEVISGLTNDNEIIINHGVTDADEILLTTPTNADDLNFVFLDNAIKEKIIKEQEEAKKIRQAKMLEKMESIKDDKISDDNSSGGGVMITF